MTKSFQLLLATGCITIATVLACSSAYAWDQSLVEQIKAQAPKLPVKAIENSLQYLEANPTTFSNQAFIGITNYDQPSTEPRFYLIDLQSKTVKISLVAHGKKSSDPSHREIAKSFSNVLGSNMSSLGFFRTFRHGELTIKGDQGIYSEKGHLRTRLRGLEPTNNMAETRDIVVHAASVVRMGNDFAPYVSKEYIKYRGFLGETEGCLGFHPDEVDAIVQQLEGAALIYGYSAQLDLNT